MRRTFLKLGTFLFLSFGGYYYAQNMHNKEYLTPFVNKIRENKEVTNILFIGDSHIQADYITSYLREQFQSKYGNAGRGLIFPYAVANSNGPNDFISNSNQVWETFRLVYDQDVFQEMGASGFVMGNNRESFIEIVFKNPNDSFNKVIIFNDAKMEKEPFSIYDATQSIKEFIHKKLERINYKIQQGETFPELASKFYTTTTKLQLLNGPSIQNPRIGEQIKVDKISIEYNNAFENKIKKLSEGYFSKMNTEVSYANHRNRFLIKTNSQKGNIFYGFLFLNGSNKGVVFNTVGVNGATYADFFKYQLQLEQLKSLKSDILMIALGTNESLGKITKYDFKANVIKLISEYRKINPNFPIILISPTDNNRNPKKVIEIVKWLKEVSSEQNVAFLDLWQIMGGEGYFKRALYRKEANADGVHFLPQGYNQQAKQIWNELEGLIK